jgi:hypothetical protein
MRKLVLVMLVALALPAVASARPAERGDGTLAIKNASGGVTVIARGTMLGRLADGALTVADLSPNGTNDVQDFGFDRKPRVRADGTSVYQGTDVRFRIVGGQYSVVILGSGINLSAVGRGRVVGQGITDGLFSTDGSPYRTVQPLLLYTDTFGQQQTTAGPTQP